MFEKMVVVPARNETPGDPARSLALLWGRGAKTSRSGVTVPAIVDCGIKLADRDGIDAVSIRRIADLLGVGAMTLYTHVPAKADLIDLMIDRTFDRLYTDPDEPVRTGGWRAALDLIAERNWILYQRHPWMLEFIGSRPVLGPHTSVKYETELRPLDGIGLTDVEMDSVLTLVLTHVAGTAKMQAGLTAASDESGMTDAQWWEVAGPLLGRFLDTDKFPVSTRVGAAAGIAYNAATDPIHALRFGLDRILDGVNDLVERRRDDRRPGA
jgi:AcrR family transcriptional regulator